MMTYIYIALTVYTYQCNNNIRIPPSLQFLHPTLRARERIRIRYIVHDDRRGRAPVIHGRQRPIALLAGRIPNFELHRGIVEGDRLGKERRADGRFLEFEELVAHESHDEAGFANGRVAQQD